MENKEESKTKERAGTFNRSPRTDSRPRRPEAEKRFDSNVLAINRVTRVTAGGRRMRFQAVVAIGDKKGKVGVGIGKAGSVKQAIEKAVKVAEKSMITVPLKEGLIPYSVKGKFGASEIVLKYKAKGGGLIAGSSVRVLCELAGITDASARVISRSSNKLNIAQATINAFQKLS
jgi:small subunit ribosomal protein S5